MPGLRGFVERPAHIRYRGFGLDGKLIERTARGFHARVVQHECDHLDGRLYPSRMRDLSKLIFESEIRHFHGGVMSEDAQEARRKKAAPKPKKPRQDERPRMTTADARSGAGRRPAPCRL